MLIVASTYVYTCIIMQEHSFILVGTLNFVTLFSARSLPRDHDAYSPSISTDGGFLFGTNTIYHVHVRFHEG